MTIKNISRDAHLKFFIFKDFNLLKHISIMVFAALIGGVFNYIFQIFMGRMLGPEQYGVFGSLFAISYIIFILSQTIQMSSAHFISQFRGKNEIEKIRLFTKGLLLRMFIFGFILYIFYIMSSSYIAEYLKIDSVFPVIIIGSIFIFALLLPVSLGILQGLEKFHLLGLNNILNYFLKLAIGILFVYLGFGVNGAVGAVVLGFIIAFFISLIFIKKYTKINSDLNNKFDYKKVYKYSFPAMIGMFCVSVPANIDVILVKHYFLSESAGLFTASTVLGKMIIFGSTAVALTTFPKISKLFSEKKNTTFLLNSSLVYTGLISGIAAIIFWIFPSQIIIIAYGSDYLGAIPILKWYGISMFFFSLTVVLIRYSLAIHDLKFTYITLFISIIEILLWVIYHNSIFDIVIILFIVNFIMFLISYIYVNLRKNYYLRHKINNSI